MEEWLSYNNVTRFGGTELVNTSTGIEGIEQFEFSEKFSRQSKSLVDIELYKKLLGLKDKINSFSDYDKWSKLINTYEKATKIKKSSNKNYYKMYEVLKYFEDLISREFIRAPGREFIRAGPSDDQKMKTLHLNENGSYIKAVRDIYKNVDWYAQVDKIDTVDNDLRLVSDSNLDPTKKHWFTKDEEVDGSFDLITSETNGKDSKDSKDEEQYEFQDIFNNAVMALSLIKEGGTYIFKAFDIFTKPTAQLIRALTMYYREVYIIKPRISKNTTSEKYVVCISRNNKIILPCINELYTYWNSVTSGTNEKIFCRDLGPHFELDDKFQRQMYESNNKFLTEQIKYIEYSLNGPKEAYLYPRVLEAFQNKRAIEFYEAFDLIDTENSFHDCKHSKPSTTNVVNVCDKCLRSWI